MKQAGSLTLSKVMAVVCAVAWILAYSDVFALSSKPTISDVLKVLRDEYGAPRLVAQVGDDNKYAVINILRNILSNRYPEARDYDGEVDYNVVIQTIPALTMLNAPSDVLPLIVPYLDAPDNWTKERAINSYILISKRNNLADRAAEYLAPRLMAAPTGGEDIVRFWGYLDSPKALDIALQKMRQVERQLPQTGTEIRSGGFVDPVRPLVLLIAHMEMLHHMTMPAAIQEWSQLMTRIRQKYGRDSHWDKLVSFIEDYDRDDSKPWLPPEVAAALKEPRSFGGAGMLPTPTSALGNQQVETPPSSQPLSTSLIVQRRPPSPLIWLCVLVICTIGAAFLARFRRNR